ncbi:MAG: hypothetical protein EON48_09290 [Acetobacteraceae bacterium]|nr:MAG: hypothetical protein EON48_09290 [Acetobacteraceae bacterium]
MRQAFDRLFGYVRVAAIFAFELVAFSIIGCGSACGFVLFMAALDATEGAPPLPDPAVFFRLVRDAGLMGAFVGAGTAMLRFVGRRP